MTDRKLLFVLLFALLLSSCAKVPITGRRQLKLLPESMLMNMSLASYNEFLSTSKVIPSSNPNSKMVSEVGNKIAGSVFSYMEENKIKNKSFNFEFNVVENDQVNAWCMPGGKVVFYAGILPIAKDAEGIAVVMGHEIAHALANHGNERMSQQMALMLGSITLEVALHEKPQETKDIFLMAYGVGGNLGMLAYSRKHELEADKLGMVLMAMAGYNPERALSFWQEMSKLEAPGQIALLSTHPSGEARVKAIREFLPEAMKYYKPRK